MSDFEYTLPESFIAQFPKDKRDESKLLVLDRKTLAIQHRIFKDITEFIKPGDCLVINKTKVFPAKVFCKKATGGNIEILFLRKINENSWAGLCRQKILDKNLFFSDGKISAKVLEKNDTGEFILEFEPGIDVFKLINEFGEMPLPPYIKRKAEKSVFKKDDYKKYQTVYAKVVGSIAAPTAGLHFTEDVLKKLKEKGVKIAEIVLHIGWGTFRPIISEDVSKHVMLPEKYEIGTEQAEMINCAKKSGGKIFAAGTSAVRTLETVSQNDGLIKPTIGETGLFIYPGYKFKCVDAMITNFHLPKSTPIVLVSALAGRENILNAYRSAIENNYSFYSYGDAMLIL
ncbi:MAG: tRNA preQ1(34) S-adenosylmethionine ribosyltransferase-isomerase QueA [Elusimicrobiota bacterium]